MFKQKNLNKTLGAENNPLDLEKNFKEQQKRK